MLLSASKRGIRTGAEGADCAAAEDRVVTPEEEVADGSGFVRESISLRVRERKA